MRNCDCKKKFTNEKFKVVDLVDSLNNNIPNSNCPMTKKKCIMICAYLYILKVNKSRWQKHIIMSLECLPLLFAKIPSKMHSRTRMHLFLLPAWFKGPFFSFWHNQLGYSRNVQKSNKNRFFPIGTFHENFPIISSRNLFVEGQFWLILAI